MKLTEAEWKVMNIVWERGRNGDGVTAREVLDAVEDETDWAYTTTKTIMARLGEKGVLRSEMRGNTTHYSAQVTRDDARRSEVRSLLNRAFDGTLAPLMHFLVAGEKLSDADKAELRRLLEDKSPEKPER